MDLIESNNQLQSLINSIIRSHGQEKLIFLLQCFQKSATIKASVVAHQNHKNDTYKNNKQSIEKVFQFTLEQFHSHITLHQAASTACMSIPSFCHYFKHYTNKTYIDYLNEIRIEH